MPSKLNSYRKSLTLILNDLDTANTELTNRVKAYASSKLEINTVSLDKLLEEILTHLQSMFTALSDEVITPITYGIAETVSKISDLINQVWNEAEQKVSLTQEFNQQLLQEIKGNIALIMAG